MPYLPAHIAGDPWMIPNPDPTRHYRWLSKAPAILNEWLRAFGDIPGYAIEQGRTLAETKALAVKLGFSESLVSGDNRIELGQNVLASIPVEEYHRRVKEKIDEQIDRRREAEDRFHEAIDELPGIRSVIEDPKETDEKIEFFNRESRPFSGQAGVGESPTVARLRRRLKQNK